MDYYDPMVPIHSFRAAAITALIVVTAHSAGAQPAKNSPVDAQPPPVVETSELDAELFYEIFLGEISSQNGDPGAGYAFMLEAARRSVDGRLYQRAADIALQARSGEYALAAAKAWKDALPQSREANRYVLQILIALNRINETGNLLRQEMAQTPPWSKVAALDSLPQLYARVSDKPLAAKIVEATLAPELAHPATAPAVWATVGRLRLAANDPTGALEAARKGYALDSASESVAKLLLEMLQSKAGDVESLVAQSLAQQSKPELHMAYARLLLDQQRYAQAAQELELITSKNPDLAEPWLILATLKLQEGTPDAADKAQQRFKELVLRIPNPEIRTRGLNQAYLLQSQIAEKKGDFSAAEAALARIDDDTESFGIQSRRALLLARQGKLPQARALLRSLPSATPEQQKMKLLAEIQLLRELRQFEDAYHMQAELVALDPQDSELLYDQAMLAEKAGKPELMEKQLRQLIARDPKHFHAYNALGYSFADRGVHLEEARELIRKALELAPQDPFITDSLGWVEFRMGNKADARRHLEAAYQLRADVEIATHLGEVLWSIGDREGALRVWREGQKSDPQNQTLTDTLRRLGVSL